MRIEISEINFEPWVEEDRSIVFQKNSKLRADRGTENQFVKNPKPRAEEDKSIGKPRSYSNLKQKKIRVSFLKKKRTLNLTQTEGQRTNL